MVFQHENRKNGWPWIGIADKPARDCKQDETSSKSTRAVLAVGLGHAESSQSMAGGATSERAFSNINTFIRFGVIHAVSLPSIFKAGFLFVSTRLAYNGFGSHVEGFSTSFKTQKPL